MSRLKRENDELCYRIYVTDSLKFITKVDTRYYDWISREKPDTRSAEEIAADVIKNAGLIVVENGSEG